MSFIWRLFWLSLCLNQQTELAVLDRKFVYQKDWSEYCRRRVIPSVIMARQVVGTFSQILHFSRLEVPYSCYISVRAEVGSNIIVVMEIQSEANLKSSCANEHHSNQFLVYEMGETFGGYWGALPDTTEKEEGDRYRNSYTLKTTRETVRRTLRTLDPRFTTETPRIKGVGLKPEEDQKKTEYLTIEVPLLNVSGRLVEGELPEHVLFDIDDLFDVQYDVRPKPGVEYRTEVIPLVEFSQNSNENILRSDIVYTPDQRLTHPTQKPTSSKRNKYWRNNNRRLNFGKNKHLFSAMTTATRKEKMTTYSRHTPYKMRSSEIVTRNYGFIKSSSSNPYSWEAIDDIMKNITNSRYRVDEVDNNLSNLLRGLAKTNYTKSDKIAASSVNTKGTSVLSSKKPTTLPISFPGVYKTGSITWRPPSATYRMNDFLYDEKETTNNSPQYSHFTSSTMQNNYVKIKTENATNSVSLLPTELDVDRGIVDVMIRSSMDIKNSQFTPPISATANSSFTTRRGNPLPMSLVDHESWENIVQSASVMAVALNQTTPDYQVNGSNKVDDPTEMRPVTRKRKKRSIKAIPIEVAKPHHMAIKPDVTASVTTHDWVSEAEQFRHIIELEDDGIHERDPPRYLALYTGSLLFNICNFVEPTTRHVYMFNSSRLVFAIANFTMTRLRVVVTPANILTRPDAHCSNDELECQVSGARVCIDSLGACDGIPNCGSYEIYDEDRLMCGVALGSQRNVYLAALTVLILVLTCFYTVHYWLRRCVPKVSDAFFVFKDTSDNVLNLDTIMRSPLDSGDGKFYRGPGMEDLRMFAEINKHRHSKRYCKYLKVLLCFFRWKSGEKVSDSSDIIDDDLYAIHSYSKVIGDLRLSVCDTAIQTGSSLEMQEPLTLSIRKEPNLEESVKDSTAEENVLSLQDETSLDLSLSQHLSELSILRFARRQRSESMQMPTYGFKISNQNVSHPEEEIIQVHEFSTGRGTNVKQLDPREVMVHSEPVKVDRQNQAKKQLRFVEEKLSTRMSTDTVTDDVIPRRRSVVFGPNKTVNLGEMESIEESEEPGGIPTSKESKSYFWNKNKTKKVKKKTTK